MTSKVNVALWPSALITDQGRKVLFRLDGKILEVSQQKLRKMLGVNSKGKGLGISIDGDRFTFEFTGEDRPVELTTRQLSRRLVTKL